MSSGIRLLRTKLIIESKHQVPKMYLSLHSVTDVGTFLLTGFPPPLFNISTAPGAAPNSDYLTTCIDLFTKVLSASHLRFSAPAPPTIPVPFQLCKSSNMDSFQWTPKAYLCHTITTWRVLLAQNLQGHSAGQLPSGSILYPQDLMNASTFVVLEILHVCLLCLGWKPPWPKWKGTSSFFTSQ